MCQVGKAVDHYAQYLNKDYIKKNADLKPPLK